MEFEHPRFVPHGVVASAQCPSRLRTLFRSDEVVPETGETIRGNEWWCLDGPDGLKVDSLDDQQVAFRDFSGEVFIMQESKSHSDLDERSSVL